MQQSPNKKNNQMPAFYRFVSLYQDYLTSTRDYGDGIQRSMVEMHILSIICQEPGITVGQVAKQWGRTKGAASQNVTKLEKQDLVVRTKLLNNAKQIHLYPTKKGQLLAKLHSDYDKYTEQEITNKLFERCSIQELENFTRILEIYSDVLEEIITE